MEIIYADSLFFINLAVNYFILLATAKICALKMRRWRIALGAALGAAYSVLTVLPAFRHLASGGALKLLFAAAMLLAAFHPAKRFLRAYIVFLAVAAAFGGAVYAVSTVQGTASASGSFIRADMRVLAVSFALCYALISLVFRRAGAAPERVTAEVTLRLGERSASLRALCDTGNQLYDPVSGAEVMIAERDALLPLFSPCLAERVAAGGGAVELLQELSTLGAEGFRLLPYSAVGVDAGLLLAFSPESAEVDGARRELTVALSPTALSPDGTYSALIGGKA